MVDGEHVQPGASRASYRAMVSVVLLAVAATCIGVLGAMFADVAAVNGDAGVIGGVVLVVIAGIPLLWRLRTDKLDGPGIYGLIAVLFLGITSLAWLGSPTDPGPGLLQRDIGSALVVVALGLAAFAIGTRVAAGRAVRSPLLSVPRRLAPAPIALVAAFAVALAGALLGLVTGTYGYIATPQSSAARSELVISLLAGLGGLVVLATAITYFAAREKQLLVPLVVFVVVEAAVGFFFGFKAGVLQSLVFVGLVYLRTRQRIPWLGASAVILVTLVVLVPVNDVYRLTLRNGSEAPVEALTQTVTGRSAETTSSSHTNPTTYVFTRFRLVDSVALVVADTPSQFPYAGGTNYWSLPAIIAVPRAFWPSKPQLTDAGDFSHTYWGQAQDVKTATPLTQPGDLYRNFGIAGVVIGLLVWGLAIGGWQRARRRWSSPRMEMVYLYSLVYVVAYVESDLPNLVATAAKTLPFAFAVAWLLLPGRMSQPGYRQLIAAGTRRFR